MAGRSSRNAASSTATCTTSPNTTVHSPNTWVSTSLHSIATGDSATRNGATFSDGSRVRPTASNSEISGG